MVREVEQRGELSWPSVLMAGIWKTRRRVPQLVEEWMYHGLDGGQPLRGCVLQELGNEIDGGCVRFAEYLKKSERVIWQEIWIIIYLAERMRFDLRELVLHVIWIHCANLISRWSTKHLDDLNKLVNA
jgi:hypothetical protein